MKRRSSLRIKDIKFDYNSNSNTNKKIQWNIPEQRSENKKKSIKDTKTPYISYDGEEDIYLKKITEINRMDQTKAKLEEYAKKKSRMNIHRTQTMLISQVTKTQI